MLSYDSTAGCCGLTEIYNFPYNGSLDRKYLFQELKDLFVDGDDTDTEVYAAHCVVTLITQQSNCAEVLKKFGFVSRGASRNPNSRNQVTLYTLRMSDLKVPKKNPYEKAKKMVKKPVKKIVPKLTWGY